MLTNKLKEALIELCSQAPATLIPYKQLLEEAKALHLTKAEVTPDFDCEFWGLLEYTVCRIGLAEAEARAFMMSAAGEEYLPF